VILEDWNNTLVRLAPASIVAKVGTSHFRDARFESLERELVVAGRLAAHGAPVVQPRAAAPTRRRIRAVDELPGRAGDVAAYS
jgi:hypothetical protein